ncbi:MAG: M43 family zinc metalloprotease, partial [Bacteroidota bacterium]
ILNSYEEDIHMKDSFHWDTHKYINVYLINKGPATAYAHLPHFHGRADDGIVITYPHIGQQEALSTPLIHEMGHYLGLYHTFEGGCKNQSCLLQGDRVCDTPPDAGAQFFEGCEYNNSCHTDADDHSEHNKFHEDHHDLNNNFMDYNRGGCLQSFTPGQIARMRLSIEEVRKSLLETHIHPNRNNLAITQVNPEILQENILANRLTTAVFHTGEAGIQSLRLETIQNGELLSFQTQSQYMSPYSSHELSWSFPPTLQFAPFSLRLIKETPTEMLIQEWTFQSPEWDVSSSSGLDILEASIIPSSPAMASALGCIGSPLFRFQLADEPLIDSHEYLFLNFGVGENATYLPLNLQVSFNPNIPMKDSLQLWVSYDLGENWQKEAWGISPEELAALNLQNTNSHASECADWESFRINLPPRGQPYQAQLRYQSFGRGVSMAFSPPSLLSTGISIQQESQLLSLNIGNQQWTWILALSNTASYTASLSDLQGRNISLRKESGGGGELQLRTSGGIPAGIYFLTLSTEVERFYKKVMVY